MSKTTMRIAAVILAAGLSGAIVGCTDTTDPVPMDPPVTEEQPTEQPTDEPAAGVTMEEATQIAIDAHGGSLVSVEEDDHNGEATWNVELTGTADGDIEVDVSQATGTIVAVDGE